MAIETTTDGVVYGTGDFFTHVLNDLFLPGVADTVITPNVLLSRLPRDKTRVQGRNVVFPIHTGRNIGVNAIGADGELPDPGAQAYDSYSFPVRHIYGRIKFDGISMDASADDIASWLRVVESEVKGLARDLSRQRQRMYHNDGSGRLAQVDGAVAAATPVVVKINQDIAQASTATAFNPTKFIKPGMRIAFISEGAGAPAGTPAIEDIATVDSVTAATNTVTFTAVVTVADNAYLVLISNVDQAGSPGAELLINTAFANEPIGLAAIFLDTNPTNAYAETAATAGFAGDFQGIDSSLAANDFHRANILDNGGVARDLTNLLMDQAYTRSIEVGDAEPTLILGSFGMIRSYADIQLDQREYVNIESYDGGYQVLAYNQTPMIADRDSYTNRFYFIDETDLRVYVMSDPRWMNMDGSIYQRLLNKDAYQATMFCRETLGSDVRDRQTLLADLKETA